MATSNRFGDYIPNENDFVPFVSIIESNDFTILSRKYFKEICKDIQVDYKDKSDVKIQFKESTVNRGICTVKFKILKGYPTAKDPDGYMSYIAMAKKGYLFEGKAISKMKNLGMKKYGDTISITFTKATMQSIDSVIFYFKDNIDDWFDVKGELSNEWLICGNVKLMDDCACSEWETIESVIPSFMYEGYQTDCRVATNKQLDVMGYKEGYPRYQTARSIRNKNNKVIKLEYNKEQFSKGTNYIKSALKKGIPVTVGIDNRDPITPGNPDNTTDHFVVIVGMGSDNEGNYFTFYDNADSATGVSINNKLYCECKESKLQGHPDFNSIYASYIDPITKERKVATYTVTSIRTSIIK